MIVYGDRERTEAVRHVSERIARRIAEAEHARGDPRDSVVAELAIESGMLVQGLLDRERDATGVDELTPLGAASYTLCHAAGVAFAGGPLDGVTCALAQLSSHVTHLEVRMREPEGYAFYALYPDLYVAAARALPVSEHEPQVIGIRSIGTSLAGFVSGALGTRRLPVTVRPVGHPFARELRIGPELAAALLADRECTRYLVVDEGPGLSGSSFVAVSEWLIAHGVRRTQIVLFPSHAGEPGAKSTPAVQASYRSTTRAFVLFEQRFDERALSHWFADVTGPLSAPVRELSGGAWRPLLYPDAREQPASQRRDERRKYLLEGANGSRWLMKFVGLGETARRLLERARLLSEHGFTPALLAARHGFALTRWHGDATPLPRARYDRAVFVAQLARYLGFVAEHFATIEKGRGAAPDQLLELAKYNTEALLGSERAASLARYDALLPALIACHRPTATDSKLDAHEWLLLPDGRWLKADAEGHHAGHDCIGAQDPAWDLAGATLELALTEAEREVVLRALRDRAGLSLDVTKLRFYELAYAAFRAGCAHYAVLALSGWADDDAARFRAEGARYASELERRLPC